MYVQAQCRSTTIYHISYTATGFMEQPIMGSTVPRVEFKPTLITIVLTCLGGSLDTWAIQTTTLHIKDKYKHDLCHGNQFFFRRGDENWKYCTRIE